MTRRALVCAMLFWVLLPGCLVAQERWLRGKVVHPGEHDEKVPEVNLTVTIEENGNADTTTSQGLFRIVLPDIFKPGDKVTLRVDKPAWRIHLPVEGETRIPTDLRKEMVEVHLLPVGSKLFLSSNHLEKLFQDLSEKSKQQLTPDNKPVDFSRAIKDWAVKYGFSAQQAKEEIDKWIAEVKANEEDPFKLGLAAFAEKNFRKASAWFTASGEQKAQELAEARKKEETLTEETVRAFRRAGDAQMNSYMFEEALTAYARALRYVTKEHKPQLWAATLHDIGAAHWQRGTRVAGTAIHDHLTAAIQAYRQALEVYTRTDLPQDWAMTQNNLGIALWAQGQRTAGERGTQLLAEAVAAYRQALEVRTLETLLRPWAQTQKNLANALLLLQDWPNAAVSYTNVLRVDPDDREAYQAVSALYHDVLFQFPQAFALDQQWLERHPDDLDALSNFAEKHFTTSRFAECARRLTALLANPAVPPQVNVALRVIDVANVLALDNPASVPGKIDTLLEMLPRQPEDFQVTWSFGGTLHFISQHEALAPYRSWLQQFLSVLTHTDRQSMLIGLQAARATFATVGK
jgi:tetratricopeptide (TPR) repeat protein